MLYTIITIIVMCILFMCSILSVGLGIGSWYYLNRTEQVNDEQDMKILPPEMVIQVEPNQPVASNELDDPIAEKPAPIIDEKPEPIIDEKDKIYVPCKAIAISRDGKKEEITPSEKNRRTSSYWSDGLSDPVSQLELQNAGAILYDHRSNVIYHFKKGGPTHHTDLEQEKINRIEVYCDDVIDKCGRVLIYNQPNYEGDMIEFPAGKYMGNINLGNIYGRVRSFKVPRGMSVAFYSDDDAKNIIATVDDNRNDIGYPISTRTKSIIVRGC